MTKRHRVAIGRKRSGMPGVQTSGVYYPVPLHLQACFSSLGGSTGDLPVAEALCNEVVSLPIYPEVGLDAVDIVAEEIRSFYAG